MKCPHCKKEILKGFYDGIFVVFEKHSKLMYHRYGARNEPEAGDIIFKGWKWKLHSCFEHRK